MKKSLIFGIFCFLLLSGIAQAQEVEITCDKDVYYPDIYGHIDIYCNITNLEHNTKNEKVGFIFDDYLNEEVQIIDVFEKSSIDSNWQSIKPNINKDKPDYKRTRQLSQQNIQIKDGETVALWMKVKVPFASSGKFDVLYGNYVLDPWWNSSWQYRQNFTVSYNGNYNLTDYQIKLALNETIFNYSNAKSDGSDLRILYNEDQYEMPICIKDWNNTGYSEIWTKMNLSVGQSINITVYYGNPSAESISNCSNVFDFWEDWKGYANNTFPSTNWHRGYIYSIEEPTVICEGTICYLSMYSAPPAGTNGVQTNTAFNLMNFSLTMRYEMVQQNDYDGGTNLIYKSMNFSDCYNSVYFCGIWQTNNNYYYRLWILATNSSNQIVLNQSNDNYNEITYNKQIRELQGEGQNFRAIYKYWNGQPFYEMTAIDTTNLYLINPSHIAIDLRYRRNKVYEVYLRKFTYNEPTVYPQAEISYSEYQELLPKPYNFMKTLMGQALLITLGAGVIFLIMSLFIFEKMPLTIENIILMMILLIVALGLITALV